MKTISNIEHLFQSIHIEGCSFKNLLKDNSDFNCKAIFDGYEIYIAVSEEWACFKSVIIGSKDKNRKNAKYPDLLSCNDTIYMTKFALDSEDNILLLCEVPSKHLEYCGVVEILNAYKNLFLRFNGISFPKPIIVETKNQTIECFFTDDMIKTYLTGLMDDGWLYYKNSNGCSWKTIYKGRYQDYEVQISFSSGWVYFQALVNKNIINVKCQDALYKFLLELNHNNYMVKYNLVNNMIILSLEIPSSIFSFNLFTECAKTISHYLERFWHEINILAIEPEIAKTII